MKKLHKILVVIGGFAFAFLLILGYEQLAVLNANLNQLSSYNVATEDEVKVKQFNMFLKQHNVKYQIDYQASYNAIEEALPYYSFVEKINVSKVGGEVATSNTNTIEEINKYYQKLSSADQKLFDSYINKTIENTLFTGGASDEK